MLSKNLRSRREALNLSASELANRAGVKLHVIYDYENDRIKRPRKEVLEALASALSVEVGDLTGIYESKSTAFAENRENGMISFSVAVPEEAQLDARDISAARGLAERVVGEFLSSLAKAKHKDQIGESDEGLEGKERNQ
jgi:transcriptional regulator with XRE-family HTH domain